jgi:tetratricopeptide (TPR) repeat protein
MRRFSASLTISGGLLTALLATGCNLPNAQFEARAQAQKRWNEARAQVKAQLAAEQLAAGNVADASTEVSKALSLNPENTGLIVLRARTALASGDTATALPLLERVSGDETHKAEVAYLLGVIWQQRLRWEDALDCFARAAEADPSESAYFVAVVQALLQLGKPTEALEYLRGNEDRFGWTPAYHAALAECQEQLGRWSEAAAAWRMVADSSNDASVIERLATALHHAGRCTEALPLLQERIDAEQQNEPDTLRRMLADCLVEEGRLDAARAQLVKILDQQPRDGEALLLLARVHAQEGRYELALRTVRRAIDVQQDRFEPLELAAAIAFRTGQRAQAAAFARRAEAVLPGHDSFVIHAILEPLRNEAARATPTTATPVEPLGQPD